ncbi:hypothetical protein, partial [Maribellus sediminis]|uniref:hypothetical protein n=1 Tax=Maribellus sediminis TaxID=2696285 RepID=UPI00142F7CA1
MRKFYLEFTGSRKLVPDRANKLYRFWCRIFAILVVLTCCSFYANSQIATQGAAVKANFGIDADVYSDTTEVGVPGDNGTDDWFTHSADSLAPGQGVIDQSGWDTLLINSQADKNYAFVRRMSVPRNTLIGNILWIDAVYARDPNSTQSRTDASVFTTTQDKNGDNTKTWNLGDGGTPQKNDLIDVEGHMRMEDDTLYGIGGFTTISADGNSHADFEFFAQQVEYTGFDFINAGVDSGHTAWVFDPFGDVLTAGDLIVSVDFENGGTKPLTSVRIWISDGAFDSLYTNPGLTPNRPFDLTGEYDSGEKASGFGYAGIQPLSGGNDPSVWAIVNTQTSTLGAPWGSREGSQGKWFQDIGKLQFTEFAINMTHLGLDAFGGDPCNKRLGSLVVKTRSSSSFTSELKDFAGPFLFGFDLVTGVDVHDLASCEDGDDEHVFDLTTALDSAHGGTVSYHTSMADAVQGMNPIAKTDSFTNPVGIDTIWVRSENPQDTGCNAVDYFTIETYDNPICDITRFNATNLYLYNGWAKVNTPNIVSYSWSTVEGTIGGGESTDSIWGLEGSVSGIDYYVYLVDSNGCSVTCTTTVFAPIYTPPGCAVLTEDATCDGDSDGWAKLANPPSNPYLYEWYKLPDTINVIGNDTMITGLDSGTYRLVITDTTLTIVQSISCEGTVGDRDPVLLTCPNDTTVTTCMTEAEMKTAFDEWMARVVVIGSDSMLTTDWDSTSYPNICGDSVSVVWTLHDECAIPPTCTAYFKVPDDVPVDVTGPGNQSYSSCDFLTDAEVTAAFNAWRDSFAVVTNECGADTMDLSGYNAPDRCTGGTVTINFVIEDSCSTDNHMASFSISDAADVDVTGPGNQSYSSCDFLTDAEVTTAFNAWRDSFAVVTNECGADTMDLSGYNAPDRCTGGTVTINFVIEDSCSTDNHMASFSIS